MKNVFLTLAVFFTMSTIFANKSEEIILEDCEDYAFRQVMNYYDNGGNDGFMAGALFEAALYLCNAINPE